MHEQAAATNKAETSVCCGTGCAVCVLDLPAHSATMTTTDPPREHTQCCNSGCLICVRDYPELIRQTEPESQLQLLEAIEAAQRTVAAG